MIKGGVPVEEIPQSWLLRYCERDVEATGELFLLQRELLKKGGLEAINYQRCLVTPCLADIEFNGMYLDAEKVEQEVQKQEKEYEALTNRLMAFCEGASPSSTKQMREFIFNTLRFRVPTDHKGKPMVTPAGDPSVAAPVLEKLVATTQRQRTFLALRQEWARCHSDLTKYLRKLKDCVEEDGGLLRASINQGTTRTHRFSSNGLQHRIQFQNLNRNFKPLFRSRHSDWLMGEADGAQLEFRTAVHLGRDRVGLHDIVSGHDIHRHTASILNGVSAEDVTKAQRQDAKSDSFKPLYGGTSGTPAQQRYYEAFKERYQGIAETQQAWTQEVLKSKHLTTEWGMRYYWPDTRLTRSGWITNTTSIYNYPVQAFATAEVIPIALVCGWHRMAKLKSFLVNTVHDSLIAEVHPDEQEAWHDVGRRCLIDDTYSIISKLYGVDITVPLGSGVVLGDHWSVGKEVPYEADENLYKQAATKEGMI
jgi:DNA polymerase I-like protein with 3'-5' exonuclease and polymerase domains